MTRAGVTCDARLLSCSFFEPSALPLPWAFCRSQARQNRVLSEAESITGRQVDFPASQCFFCIALKNFRGKIVSRDNGAHRPQHRVSASRRCTDATRSAGVPQTALQRETGAFTVLSRGSHWDRQLLAEKTLPQKSSAALAVFEIFLGVRRIKVLSLITA